MGGRFFKRIKQKRGSHKSSPFVRISRIHDKLLPTIDNPFIWVYIVGNNNNKGRKCCDAPSRENMDLPRMSGAICRKMAFKASFNIDSSSE
jgi:hypothetical protein